MEKIPFLDCDVVEAGRMAAALGRIRNSVLGGGGNAAGYLAEIAVARRLGARLVSSDAGTAKFDRDMVLPGGQSVDLKTKRRVVAPKPHFEASVAGTSLHQRPDRLAFASITFADSSGHHPRIYRSPREIWLCGWISPEDFRTRSVLWEKGEVDPSNGFRVQWTQRSLAYSELSDFPPGPEFTNSTSSASAAPVARSFSLSSPISASSPSHRA